MRIKSHTASASFVGVSFFKLFASCPSASRSNSTYEVTSRMGMATMNPMYFLDAALYAGLEGSIGFGMGARRLSGSSPAEVADVTGVAGAAEFGTLV